MNSQGKRRKKSFKKSIKRTVYSILVAPARWLRITGYLLGLVVRACEISGILCVIAFLGYLVSFSSFIKVLFIFDSIIFVSLLLVIQLQRYQDDLEELGYVISGKAF